MKRVDFGELRRKLDDAITYADFDLARQLAQQGLNSAQSQELMGEIMYFKAQQEIIDGNHEEAVNSLDLAVQYNPSDGAAYNDRALCLIELRENEKQVLADFDKGIAVEPDYAGVYHNKGWYLNKLGRHQEAIPYFEKTLELEPGRAVTYENLGNAYLNLGKKQKAVEAFQKAVQCLNPSCSDIKDQIETQIKILNQ